MTVLQGWNRSYITQSAAQTADFFITCTAIEVYVQHEHFFWSYLKCRYQLSLRISWRVACTKRRGLLSVCVTVVCKPELMCGV